ncbi:MAG: Wzz/FepE/Etk N-terminal domain-containing protein [Armatimonadetes bacterium]|nr:Wzz/FepE/Etk N-terminal domain-containing protein [Armatimonadota bacterium]
MESRENYHNDEIDLIDYFAPLIARWKLLLVASLLGAIAMFAYSRSLPKVYQSSATIYVQQSSGASSLLRNLPISLPTSGGGSSGYLVTLLQSDSLLRQVSAQYDLPHNWGMVGKKRLNEDETIELFCNNLAVSENKGGSITIKLKAYSPDLAAKIINTMLDNLESLMVTSSKKKIAFISEKLTDTSRDLDRAEQKLTKFLENNNVTLIDEETRAWIQQMGVLEGNILELDTQLQSIKSELNSEGNLDILVSQEVKRKSLESSREFVAKKRDELTAKLANLPAMATKYAQLQREIMVLSKTYELLTEQYQMARITQKGEDGDYQIIDRARPNNKKIAPRVMLNTAIGGIITFLFVAVLINLNSAFSKRKPRRLPPASRAIADEPESEPVKRV